MKIYKISSILIFSVFLIFVISCSKNPKPINFGHDDCDYCKMTISDNRFGAEVISKQGRIFKFDDMHCVKGFLDDEILPKDNVHSVWLIDFKGSEKLIQAENSFLIQNEELRSPMGGNIATFETENELKEYQNAYSGTEIKWEDFLNSK